MAKDPEKENISLDDLIHKEKKSFYENQLDRVRESDPVNKHQHIQIRQSKAFMDEYHDSNIELDKISAAAFMSKFHYIRTFQKVYGITPRQYLRDKRISKAKELLKSGRSVTEVCFDVGYESLTTFSKAFKNGTGLSPREYQTQNISNPG